MLPSIVVSIIFMLIAVLAGATLNSKASATATRLELKRQAQLAVTQATTNYLLEKGSLPTSLTQLQNTSGYEYVQQYNLGNLGVSYTLSNALTPSSQGDMSSYFPTFKRAAIVALNDTTISTATFLSTANNKCPGTPAGGFATTLAWCGDSSTAAWSVVSEREASGGDEVLAIAVQKLTVDKFRVRYDALFPTAFKSFGYPSAASPILLVSVAVATPGSGSSVGLTAAQCFGTFTWSPTPTTRQGIPLSCGDLYNSFGQPVSYQRTSTTRMVLTSNSRYFAQDGITPKVLTTSSS
jgi:hypothetical protein